jgi:glycosyltransferase involved in cell wall biosynthesis
MRVKIVDAWSWGIPVVATTVGAEGLAYTAGEHLLIADDAAAFADATVRLLTDPEQAAHLRSAGRRLVEASYDWRRIYAAWDAIYAPTLPILPFRAKLEAPCN